MMSFIEVPEGSHFSYENLPYGVFSTAAKVSEAVSEYFIGIIIK